jgi:hypothetical protein
VLLVLAGAACGDAASGQADPGAAQAAQMPTCRASQLHALFRGFRAAGGSLTAAVVVASTGPGPCMVTGTPPSVTLLDGSGGAIPVKSHAVAVPENAGAVELVPGAALPGYGAPPASGSAWFVVTWSNWCSDTLPAVSSLLVVLPGGGSVVAQPDTSAPSSAAGPSAPRCDDARAGSTVEIDRFQAPVVQPAVK